LIGDAAGAVSPLTAGGLDACMRLSRFAADVILEALSKGSEHISEVYNGAQFRKQFQKRLWMRTILDQITNPLPFELGIRAARIPLVRNVISDVFFGRGSFPDSSPARRPALSPKAIQP
jgi:flavin-dependent dehydrogenase